MIEFEGISIERKKYICLLEKISRKHRNKNYLINIHGEERCNYMVCNKHSKLQMVTQYKFCHTHRNKPPIHTKQYNILLDHYDEIKQLIISQRQIIFKSTSPEYIPLSNKIMIACNKFSKNIKECGAVDCPAPAKQRKFGDWFCLNHILELSIIRRFKKVKLPLDEEIRLREYELSIRKNKDVRHIHYVKCLKFNMK